jgi:formylglycine-generating enzyme required for sulfatase activity
VTISPFKISETEVTRAQYKLVMGVDPVSDYSTGIGDPVQVVNWYRAISFCNLLSLREGLTPVYTVEGVDFSTLTFEQIPTMGNGLDTTAWKAVTSDWDADGYRLPTRLEATWAAMGADVENPGEVNTTGWAKAFAGSDGTNVIDDYAWYAWNSWSSTSPAGTKLPNELGLYDMSGNVAEWVWDFYGLLPAGSLTDYRGPASGTFRLNTGGAWSYQASSCTVSNPGAANPLTSSSNLGFRVVRR